MKYSLFAPLGDEYPLALEQRYERILKKIAELWCDPEIDAYFTSLLIDTRGGRQGFETDVFLDIQRLYKFLESQRLREVEDKHHAIRELESRGINFQSGAFLAAVEAGNQALVDLFVRGGMNIHIDDGKGNPLLIVALKKGYTVVANILLTAGADPNLKDRSGFTPLLLACGKDVKGFKEIAMKLIRMGADVNTCDPLGWTPLMLAVSGGTVEVAELLLEHGANPTLITRKGENVYSVAEKFGREELLSTLYQKGWLRSGFFSH